MIQEWSNEIDIIAEDLARKLPIRNVETRKEDTKRKETRDTSAYTARMVDNSCVLAPEEPARPNIAPELAVGDTYKYDEDNNDDNGKSFDDVFPFLHELKQEKDDDPRPGTKDAALIAI